jgi:transcriptional regulator with XRE-family HTH domain
MPKPKRSNLRIITSTSKILRYMRMSRKISMRAAGARNGISDSSIAHYETGRMDVFPERICQLVESYGYPLQDFEEFKNGRTMPTLSLKDECYQLIDRLDETKLRAIHAMLTSFVA